MPTLLTLALISSDVYNDGGGNSVNGFRRLIPTPRMNAANHRDSSFFGACYANGDVGVVAFRGSAERTDWLDADLDIGLGNLPIDQFGDALDFFIQARQALSTAGCSRLVVTGHSLGGGLTQLVAGSLNTVPTRGVTFNAPGMAGLSGPVRVTPRNAANVYNFRARHDPVSLRGAHIGHAPVVVDVQLGTGARVAAGVAGGLGTALGGALGGLAGQAAVTSGFEHTMAPMVEALRSGGPGGLRF